MFRQIELKKTNIARRKKKKRPNSVTFQESDFKCAYMKKIKLKDGKQYTRQITTKNNRVDILILDKLDVRTRPIIRNKSGTLHHDKGLNSSRISDELICLSNQ